LLELVRRIAGPEIEIDVRPRDGIWTVMCDPNQLENVLLNLAINARDAMPNGGKLTITTSDLYLSASDVIGQEGAAPGDYVEIAVSDTGMGMD
jgi:signal transduction histidine kinase